MNSSGEPMQIVIVGGGSAGWMTAGLLANIVGRTRKIAITLVEADDIGIIGVGEATIPTMVSVIRDMGISEDEFLANVNGAFKQAIRFQNWLYDPEERSSYYYHPFHKMAEGDIFATSQHLNFNPELGPESFGRIATPQVMACDANKAPGPLAGAAQSGLTYAYHMDAVLFGQFLRRRFENNPVLRIVGHVEGAERNESNGDIRTIVLRGGAKVEGDLFIDCSGFRGLLINQQLAVPFQSFSRWLPCDRALAVSVPYRQGERVKPYTQATAQKHGWIWDINLANRRGVGHVYSSAFCGKEEAESHLKAYLGASWREDSEVREIPIRVGRGERLWENNCIAIGLSGGFIEPLESTGIYLIEMGIRYLIDHWPSKGITPAHRYSYNKMMHDAYDEVLQFVFMHYYTSQRRDTDFWRSFPDRLDTLPGDLGNKLSLWRHKYPSAYDARAMPGKVFGFESMIGILSGMKWFDDVQSPYVVADRQGLMKHLRWRLAEFERQVSTLPSHEQYLRHHGVAVSPLVGKET
jgi:tryptophan 7-halogenase